MYSLERLNYKKAPSHIVLIDKETNNIEDICRISYISTGIMSPKKYYWHILGNNPYII